MKDTPCPSAGQAQRGNEPWFTQLTPERWRMLTAIGLSQSEMRVACFLVVPWLKARKAKKLTPYAAVEIAAATGVSESTVWRTIRKLDKAGFLEVDAGGGRRKRNRYRPLFGAYEASRNDLKGPLKARRNYVKSDTAIRADLSNKVHLQGAGIGTLQHLSRRGDTRARRGSRSGSRRVGPSAFGVVSIASMIGAAVRAGGCNERAGSSRPIAAPGLPLARGLPRDQLPSVRRGRASDPMGQPVYRRSRRRPGGMRAAVQG